MRYDNEDKPPSKSVQRKQNSYFHIIMTLGSAYLCMLLTNWGTNNNDIETVGKQSMYVNIVCQWVVFGLFWWTLCAPLCCGARFHNKDDEDDE